jgi:hypothetical protein
LRLPSRSAAALLGAAIALALPAAASANDFQTVYRDYKRGGAITPCKYSDKQLANAERQTPPDVEQYAPSFLDALAAARERNADCGKKPAALPPPAQTPPTPSTPQPVPTQPAPVTSTPPATGQPPAPTVPAQPAVAGVPSPPVNNAERQDSTPAALWILAGLGALALLAALWALLARWFGWSADRWARPWRASASDFAGRFADRRVEFTDWLRTGY